MSNFISIISTAYKENSIDEARGVWNSISTIKKKWDEPANEIDFAKIVGFAAKILGTIALTFLALNTFAIASKKTASLARLVFTAASFFMAADLLQARNNLYNEYTSPFKKLMRLMTNEVVDLQNPKKIEEFRAMRVIKVAVKDTYVLGPLFQAAVDG